MIELHELIRDLRSELMEAMAAAPEEGLQFELGPIELEVSFGVEKSGGGGAKVKFWVVSLESEGKVAATSLQKVTLTLSPRTAGSSAPPYVSGRERLGER
uniref:trypco2 family protein n=1 Tax=Herbidospora sakaeratensis TaxID=564415 RepID=UPI0007816617|nr:trypco2 family protein [Herbidospora sakaeratensis]